MNFLNIGFLSYNYNYENANLLNISYSCFVSGYFVFNIIQNKIVLPANIYSHNNQQHISVL